MSDLSDGHHGLHHGGHHGGIIGHRNVIGTRVIGHNIGHRGHLSASDIESAHSDIESAISDRNSILSDVRHGGHIINHGRPAGHGRVIRAGHLSASDIESAHSDIESALSDNIRHRGNVRVARVANHGPVLSGGVTRQLGGSRIRAASPIVNRGRALGGPIRSGRGGYECGQGAYACGLVVNDYAGYGNFNRDRNGISGRD